MKRAINDNVVCTRGAQQWGNHCGTWCLAPTSRRWRAALPWLPQSGVMHGQLEQQSDGPLGLETSHPRWVAWIVRVCVHALVRATDRLQSGAL